WPVLTIRRRLGHVVAAAVGRSCRRSPSIAPTFSTCTVRLKTALALHAASACIAPNAIDVGRTIRNVAHHRACGRSRTRRLTSRFSERYEVGMLGQRGDGIVGWSDVHANG